MVDIEVLKQEIIERLKPLDPEKIILFGSYAYGAPNEDSDVDLFLVKDDIAEDELDRYDIEAMMKTRDLISKYHIGFDILSASSSFLNAREDYFYKVDILEKGKIFYERSIS